MYADNATTTYVIDRCLEVIVIANDLKFCERLVWSNATKDAFFIKRSLLAKMSFQTADICVIGAQNLRLLQGAVVELEVSSTLYNWLPSVADEYAWTLEVAWDQQPTGAISLPSEVFARLASKVLSKEVVSLRIAAQGGFWVEEGLPTTASARGSVARYLKPGSRGRLGESVICNIIDIEIECSPGVNKFSIAPTYVNPDKKQIQAEGRLRRAIDTALTWSASPQAAQPLLLSLVTFFVILVTRLIKR